MSEISFEEDNFGTAIKAQAFSIENRNGSSDGMVGFLIQL